MEPTKKCPRCGIVKPYSEYHLHKSGRKIGKPQSYCKICDSKRSHDDHLLNQDKENKAKREKYYQNQESEKARRKQYYEDHLEEEQRKARERYYENQNVNKEKRRQYYNEHIEEERRKGRERWYAKGSKPASDNPECSKYMGDFAEKALSVFFKTMTRMPNNNPGYDFLCNRGFKIDAKSSCILTCRIGKDEAGSPHPLGWG